LAILRECENYFFLGVEESFAWCPEEDGGWAGRENLLLFGFIVCWIVRLARMMWRAGYGREADLSAFICIGAVMMYRYILYREVVSRSVERGAAQGYSCNNVRFDDV
jgi:hypothetical protein